MTDKVKLIDPTKCPTKVVAKVFGCSEVHLRNLVKQGQLEQTARGKYDLEQTAKYFLQANKETMTELQIAKLDAEQEKARRLKRLNDEESLKLVRVENVEEFVHGYTGEFIQLLQNAKKSTSALLTHDTRKKFNKKIDDALTSLADKLEAWHDICTKSD